MAPSAAALPSPAPAVAPSVLGRRLLLERLGSLLGILPLGLWTGFHLWNNLAAFSGPRAWSDSVTRHENLASGYAGVAAVVAFLVWHTVWGLNRLAKGRPSTAPYLGNWRYLFQRLSALGLLLFLGAHLWLAYLQPHLKTGQPEPFADIAAHMAHHLPTLLVYLLGTLGIAFHLANGLSSFAFGWGLVSSQRGFQASTAITVIVFLFLLIVGWTAIYALWHAGQPLPPPLD